MHHRGTPGGCRRRSIARSAYQAWARAGIGPLRNRPRSTRSQRVSKTFGGTESAYFRAALRSIFSQGSLEVVSHTGRAAQPACRFDVRRRAADARTWHGADDPAEVATS